MDSISLYQFINHTAFHLINGMGFKEMDSIMILISNKFVWIPLYIYILYLLFKKDKENYIWTILAIILLIFFADSGSVHLFKNQFEVLRPCHTPDIISKMRFVTDCGGKYGFISSHASNSFAIAFFIFLLLKNKTIFFWLFNWAAIIAFSRVYLGVHFPYDVIGGMIWGGVVSLFVYKLYTLKIK